MPSGKRRAVPPRKTTKKAAPSANRGAGRVGTGQRGSRRARPTYRTLTAYIIHARSRDGVIDYVDFFTRLAALDYSQRQVTRAQEAVAIPLAQQSDDKFVFRVVVGVPGAAPVLFDVATGRSRLGRVRATEFVESSSVVVVDPTRRVVVIERRRPGVPIPTLERLLSRLGRTLGAGPGLTVSLTPIPSESFLAEIEGLARIRRAEVSVARPNYDWTDAAAKIAALGAESNAADMELVATAPRGESLAPNAGVMADVRSLAQRAITPIRDARITGRRSDQGREVTVSLDKHVQKKDAIIPPGLEPQDQEAAVVEQALTFADEVAVTDESTG